MLRDDKKTIILTTQFFDEAELVADRLMVLSAGMIADIQKTINCIGKLIAMGKVEDVKRQFGTGHVLHVHHR